MKSFLKIIFENFINFEISIKSTLDSVAIVENNSVRLKKEFQETFEPYLFHKF